MAEMECLAMESHKMFKTMGLFLAWSFLSQVTRMAWFIGAQWAWSYVFYF